jgi:signal transduction histidine kinase
VSTDLQDDYDAALMSAFGVAIAAGLAVAVGAGFILTRRLLRHLDDVQDGAGRLAAGDYSHRVPVPDEVELAQVATSVNTLAASLDQTERSRARLVSDLAHELRNPLTNIEGYMEGLIDGVLAPTTETFAEVADETDRLKRLTRDLSLLSRAQEGALEMRSERSDLASVAAATSERLRPQFEGAGVALDVVIVDPLPFDGDADRIGQVLTNLIGNAFRHTPAGGTVQVLGHKDANTCVVKIIDNGTGIPSDQLETIFQRFTRLTDGGTGIGLHIARTLARAHGGDIIAISDGPGTGSTFTLTLPAAD